jgi:hypothetical protein
MQLAIFVDVVGELIVPNWKKNMTNTTSYDFCDTVVWRKFDQSVIPRLNSSQVIAPLLWLSEPLFCHH